MSRIVMLGIGGLDADLLRVYGPSLPNFRRLMLQSPFLEMQSCFPPEAAPAWASIYTGLNPANHGILERMDYLEDRRVEPVSLLQVPHEETFWAGASRAGKRICIVNPLLAYPAQPVNGIMLALPPPGTKEGTVSITPEMAAPAETFPQLLDMPLLPSVRQLEDFCCSLHMRTAQQAAIGLELFNREPWDLFFLQLDALDHVQHFLWRYSDPGDPTYPGRNEYADRIQDFYRLFDQVIGKFRSCMQEDCVLVVVSGHGHGRRCSQRLNLNEWLRRQGLLTPRMRSIRLLDRHYLAERAKNGSLELLAQLHLHDVIPQIARRLPNRKALYRSAYLIDQELTAAQAADVAGTSPFGGISLNRACLERKGLAYEQVRASLLSRLGHLRLKGCPVVNWAMAREHFYQGKYIERYPDIVFELRSDFGVGCSLYLPLITIDATHRIISGGHTMQGVFLLENLPETAAILDAIKEPSVMDVAPTILSLLGVRSGDRDGQALVQPQLTQQLI